MVKGIRNQPRFFFGGAEGSLVSLVTVAVGSVAGAAVDAGSEAVGSVVASVFFGAMDWAGDMPAIGGFTVTSLSRTKGMRKKPRLPLPSAPPPGAGPWR